MGYFSSFMRKKLKRWVAGQVALKLDAEPFSSLPLRMRTGIFLLLGSFIIGYGGPVVALMAGGMNDLTFAGILAGTGLYIASWVIGTVGLVLAGKDSIRYPLYFMAKFLNAVAPDFFSVAPPPTRQRCLSPFIIVTFTTVLVIGCALLAALSTGNWRIFFIVGAAALVFHQILYLYGMFSPGADYFFVSLRGKDMPMAPGEILLRFDDGPDARYTPEILDLLQGYSLRAVFAVTGENVLRHPHLIRRMHEEGHIIANHTFTHPYHVLLLPYRRMLEEMVKTNDAVRAVTGGTPVYFCPPIGFTNLVMGRAMKTLALTPLMWDIRSLDTQLPPEKIVARVRKQLAPGKIVLFHDAVLPPGRSDRIATVEAVRILCEDLRTACLSRAGNVPSAVTTTH